LSMRVPKKAKVFGSGDTGLSRDKHLKLDKPKGVNLASTDARPIKVTKLVQNATKVSTNSELTESCEIQAKLLQ
jgi:hypothetical protein